jgi:hypothetical protein
MTRIQSIEQRAARATKGPWFIRHFGIGSMSVREECNWPKIICNLNPNEPDAKFIAHSREDIPLLLEAAKVLADFRCPCNFAEQQAGHVGYCRRVHDVHATLNEQEPTQ